MPTLPLYDPAPANPHDWHRVAAPGGYEWWRFDAADAARGLRLTVELFDGDPFDPTYGRAYRRFRRRPTRVAPPVPRAFPRARFILVENGRVRWHVDPRLPAGAFRATEPGGGGEGGVRVGPWTLRPGNGAGGLVLSAVKLPVSALGETRDVRIAFVPREPGPPALRRIETAERAAVDHWLVAPSAYDVSATFHQPAGGPGPLAGDELVFEGRGRFDHFYGSGPMGDELRRLVKNLRESPLTG